ncbi:peptidase family m28 domain-containing protein [Ditylenchus destructor]|nr:peptidase family m28 domain-containing protein [Ditylenchus destructor]
MRRSISRPAYMKSSPEHLTLLYEEPSSSSSSTVSDNLQHSQSWLATKYSSNYSPSKFPGSLYSTSTYKKTVKHTSPFPVDPEKDARRRENEWAPPLPEPTSIINPVSSPRNFKDKRKKTLPRNNISDDLRMRSTAGHVDAINNCIQFSQLDQAETPLILPTSSSTQTSPSILPITHHLPHQCESSFNWTSSSSYETSITSSNITNGEYAIFGKNCKEDSKSDHSAKASYLWISLVLAIFVVLLAIILLLFTLFSNNDWMLTYSRLKLNQDSLKATSTFTANEKSPFESRRMQDIAKQRWASKSLMSLFDGEEIHRNLRWISSTVHVAGTQEQLDLMDQLEEKYRDLGFDVTPYQYEDVLLSYPDYEKPNCIYMKSGADKWTIISNGLAEPLGPKEAREQQNDFRSAVWWNAYSANGNATGQIVYANYGTIEDYNILEKLNISVNGKIVLIRYGAIFRGDKVLLAEERGAIGAILYSDPYDFAPELAKDNKTFPDQIWLPPSGAQRGTLLRTVGDPSSPLLPSKHYTHRITEEELLNSGVLPAIPVTSIGYRDAIKIFDNLDGPEIQDNQWIGSLPTTYCATGKALFRLEVRSFTSRRKIKNFLATLQGREEPDRWILLGNHADAWVKGAIDPGTGTATMLEMARVLSNFASSTGWRPRRSIVFCQWDAEEFGLIGSTEFVEEMLQVVQSRVVTYINVDNINGNSTLQVKAVPILYRAIVESAKRIPHPLAGQIDPNQRTLFDAWNFYSPKGPLPGDKSIPAIQTPNSGSDFQRFLSFAGIPVCDLRMESAPQYSYMLYHSMYEIPWTADNLIDPSERVFASVGQIWLELARNIADSLIIPFNVEDYGAVLYEFFLKMDAQLLHLEINLALGIDWYRRQMGYLQESISRFHQSANRIQQIIQAVNNGDSSISILQSEMINSRLQMIERCFIINDGIFKERSFHRHAVFSPSEHDAVYSSINFALILDPAIKWALAVKNKSSDESRSDYWLETVRIGFSKLQYSIESAILVLNLNAIGDIN